MTDSFLMLGVRIGLRIGPSKKNAHALDSCRKLNKSVIAGQVISLMSSKEVHI